MKSEFLLLIILFFITLFIFTSCNLEISSSNIVESDNSSLYADNSIAYDNSSLYTDNSVECDNSLLNTDNSVTSPTQEYTSNENTTTYSYLPDVSESELNEVLSEYLDRIDSLNASDINKIELLAGTVKETVYSTTDTEIINKWIALLKKMNLTAIPFEGGTGNGYGLVIYNNDSSESIGGFVLPYIYKDNQQIMFYVNNYEELASEFEQLANSMGYSS